MKIYSLDDCENFIEKYLEKEDTSIKSLNIHTLYMNSVQ